MDRTPEQGPSYSQPPSGGWRRNLRRYLRWGLWAAALYLTGTVLYALVTLPSLPEAGFDPSRPSMVYAADGTAIGPLSGDVFRVPFDLAKAPKYVGQAFVASEDVRFYQHGGIDVKGIVRALWTDIRTGEIQEGGSTITQQVVKITFLTPRQTLRRKVQELLLSQVLEHRYRKDEILGLYLNQIYMGNGAYGVGAAARLYFNKAAVDLTLGEAAMLAGINPAPEAYNPLLKKEVAQRQRNLVLDQMAAAGYVSAEQAEKEKAMPLQLRPGKPNLQNAYPWYLEVVRAELKERYDLQPRAVDVMGLKIYTALNPAMQRTAEQVLGSRMFPSKTPEGIEGAFVAIDPRTGEIRALVGGRNHAEDGGFNRAVDGQLLPGSAIKPVMVYGPAFEYAGLTPESKLEDSPLTVDGWEPQNYDRKFRGEVTVREAARNSLNIPAVRMLQRVGVDDAKSFAGKLGIDLPRDDRSLMLALGSLSRGISPLKLVAAYQGFANGGTYYEPHAIVRVEAADGELDGRRVAQRRAMRAETAYQVTDILKTVVQQGTGTGAQIGRTMAGKTGTVELPATADFQGREGNTAAWFVGYTPDLVGGVWLGYDLVNPEHYLPPEINGSTYPASIWRQVVGAGLAGQPALAFPGPDGRTPAPAPRVAVAPKPATPKPPAPPPATEGLKAAPGLEPGTISLTWQTKGLPNSAEFWVVRGTTADLPVDPAHTVASTRENSYVERPPGPGTYYYRVAAVDMSTKQVGPASGAVEVVVAAATPAAPPTPPGEQPPPPGEQPPAAPPTPPGEQPPATPPTTPPGQPTGEGTPPATPPALGAPPTTPPATP